MKFKEKLFKRHKIYTGDAVSFSADKIILPDGKIAAREYLEHQGAVAVLAFADSNRIVMVSQYRYPVGKLTLEIPAGKLDKNETPESCVRRELEEETGFRAKKIKKLVSYWPTPAFSNEIIHIYAAFGLAETKKSPDEDEFIGHCVINFKDALKRVKNGHIKDSKTIIAILLWKSLGRNFQKDAASHTSAAPHRRS
jgi:ADP-ribose pyrophosphatase